VRTARVESVTPDGRTLVLRLDGADSERVEVALADVRAAQRAGPPTLPLAGAPSVRDIQHRIRHGETAAAIADGCGMPVEDVARYEGPPLAERAHHGRLAQRSEVDGRTAEDVVREHFERLGASPDAAWDCWQTDPQHWEVSARSGEVGLRLGWDPRAQRVEPLDTVARQAFGHEPLPADALESVLRPVQGRRRSERGERSLPAPPSAPRRTRAQVPLWDEISTEVSGRRTSGDS
jgi:hypothetical protein